MKKKKKVILLIGIIIMLLLIGGSILLLVDPYAKAYVCVKAYKIYNDEQRKIMYDTAESSSGSAESSESFPQYTDTNVRTEGVAEPDTVKTDGEYFYQTSSNGRTLLIYKPDDGQVEKVCEKKIFDENYYFKDLYIDGDKLIIMGTYSTDKKNDEYVLNAYPTTVNQTFISFWDVSDRTDPKEESTIFQDGNYCSSRMKDGVIYTFSNRRLNMNKVTWMKRSSYVPEVNGKLIKADDIVLFDKSYASYLVATSVNADSEELISSLAVMGGSAVPYVSEDNIYVTHNEYGDRKDTDLVKISFNDGNLKVEARGTFTGSLLNDYSIDEYEGNLRMVTSYRKDSGEDRRRNALFVLDENLKEVSSITDLAPGETIRSARFMGDIAYFVTYKMQDYFYDPLFAVDLSDPKNPEITDSMELPGFSGYLHPYGENKLLGIGYDTEAETGNTLCIKFSMFDTTDPFDIKEEATCNFLWCQEAYVLDDRNALMYNPEDGTFGFGAWINDRIASYELGETEYSSATKVEYTPEEYTYINDDGALIQDIGPVVSENTATPDSSFSYLLMDYDEEEGFKLLINYELSESSRNIDAIKARGIVMGDYFYLIESNGGVTSYDTTDYEVVDRSY